MTQQVLENLKIATMSTNGMPYGMVADGAIVIDSTTIAWCGRKEHLPVEYSRWSRRDLAGRLVTPGLIDCHTHIVYGGNRAREFELRLGGASYEEITAQGGGIHATLNETRKLSVPQLVEQSLSRVDALIAEGICVIEIKSGYGLDMQTELNMLRAARQIGKERPITVKTSFLGAHLAPAVYRDHPERYLDEVCIPALEKAADEGLVDAVDGFCENIAFSANQLERLFNRAESLGLPVKIHAEQLSNCGGTQLAAKYNALSADHLEYANEADVVALKKSNSVAVLLPGAFFTLRQSQKPPVQILRDHDVTIAVATDCNPGSSPLNSILLAMNFACILFDLTPEEALAGTTVSAAKALGLSNLGQIKSGMTANLAVWDVASPGELAYPMGFNPLTERIYEGQVSASPVH